MNSPARKSVDLLLPPELDYWVAKAEDIFFFQADDGRTYEIDAQGSIRVASTPERSYLYAPSSDWRIAGPIILRHRISLQACGDVWIADCGRRHVAIADNPLVAAMRVRVMLAFGQAVGEDAPGAG
ncbi:MAG: hypothetical protein H6R10_2413 [Rhodocyclaceae bacterium]|nr:hypothetical protein [Rhodocyclaceae bacterium]